MKHSSIRFIAVLLLAALPVFLILSAGFLIPDTYEKTFLGEFDDMVDRLYDTEGEKIVVIGGSSVVFGVDARLLSETLGKPVVNFGLYAALGTKMMMDYSRDAISEGDIIVLAPEMNAQTFSLYFGAKELWQAVDGSFSLLRHVASENGSAMLGSYFDFASDKLGYALRGETLDPEGIYHADAFDDFGFIRYRRDKDYNTMVGGVDTSMPIDFKTEIIDPEFAEFVNEYIAFAEKKGAKVVLSFAPMNENAIPADITMETLEHYLTCLDESFNCDILGDPNNMIYRGGYFYDSNFHLNSAGAVCHTRQLAIDLAPLVGVDPDTIKIDIPEMPEIPEDTEIYDYDANEVDFTYKMTDAGVIITGVSELGKTKTLLVTPKAYDGKKVIALAPDAFAGCDKLETLVIESTIGQIPDGAFRDATKLREIRLMQDDPNAITVNNLSGGLTEGLPADCRFFVSTGALAEYRSNYFWGVYAEWIVAED